MSSKRIAILGTAPTSRDLAPFADPSWDIWACSPGNRGVLPRVTLWFEIHAIGAMTSPKAWADWGKEYFAWLRTQPFPKVMQERNELIPDSVIYPIKEMVAKYGRNWFTSSIAYMLALAIERGAEEIAIFGVDMAADQEAYTYQKPGCVYFIEAAEKRGIKVQIPFESCLGAPVPMYGYDEASAFARRLDATIAMVQANRANSAAVFEQHKQSLNYMDGALEQLRYFRRTWADGADAPLDLGEIERRVAAMVPASAPMSSIAASAAEPGPEVLTSRPAPTTSPVRLVEDEPSALELGAEVRRLGMAGA